MVKLIRKIARHCRFFCILIFNLYLLLAPKLGIATVASAYEWLAAKQSLNGAVSLNSDIATAYQATSEVLRAVVLNDKDTPINSSKAIDFIHLDALHSTEYLSREILAISESGGSITSLLDELATIASSDGGFGEFSGFQTTVLDTAFALQALVAGGRAGTATAMNALNYLLNRQNSSGAWSDRNAASNVYITALSMRAILSYANRYSQAAAAVDAAGKFLISQQNESGLWSSDFESAQALLALVPSLADRSGLSASIESLTGRQQENGSWGGDVYVTALLLQLIALLDDPVANPGFSALKGHVQDGGTGIGLSGVLVSVEGPVLRQTMTDQDGIFEFTGMPQGQYEMTIEHPDYAVLTGTTALISGKMTDLGELNLLPLTEGTQTGTVLGTVVDADTGLPVAEAKITADAKTVLTGLRGNYQLNAISPSLVTVTAEAPGYLEYSAQVQLNAGIAFLFSPRLIPGLANTGDAYLSGSIKDAETGLALSGVNVYLDGAPVGTTDIDGTYRIEPLTEGLTHLSVSKAGYDEVSTKIKVIGSNLYEFSPSLYRSGSTPPGANTATIKGTVMNASTDLPIDGVSIKAHHNHISEMLTTDSNGQFRVGNITDTELILEFAHAGYQSTVLNIPVSPLIDADIGQIRLKPDSLTALLPDLIVSSINRQSLVTDPNSLKLGGNLQVTIKNRGVFKSADNFRLLAYYDSDKSHSYNAPLDSLLGEAVVSKELPVNALEVIDIPVDGTVPFRDAPISVWVDSLLSVTETDENNNQMTSASECRGQPLPSGTLDPVLKWQWSGSSYEPSYKQVMSTPVVAQLNDDNLDGVVNQADIPDIVFEAFSGSEYTGRGLLRAVSGKDGHEIWDNPATRRWVSAFYGPAVGDIDHDGLVEIVINGPYQSGLMVFEHNGDLKWSRSAGAAQPALADLNHDGEVEIIHGRSVFDAKGNLLWKTAQGLFDPIPLIADLDNDGNLDVFAGGVAYNHDGTVKWNGGIGHFGSAMGNFDADPFPEIVVKTLDSNLYLLEHTGAVKWGPVSIPGGGGGPITVADFDGDGEPEIGTAGANYYVVFETDGSIKWLSPTQDISSKATGSSVFDFEGDGRAEVLYGDEVYFRIFDGTTGQVLFKTPNSSDTLFEYPVVADVDNDGHAEIVVVSNNYARSGTAGIRVFESRTDNWMPTRSIWNQHAYHIDNINDDGSIPQQEPASWLTHNTFRLNTFANQNVLDQADLTAGRLILTDQGVGKPPSLSVRIGNAGLANLSRPVTVAFHQDSTGEERVLLGEAPLDDLSAGDFQEVNLENINLDNDRDLSVMVDSDARISECDEHNNGLSIPFHSEAALGRIQLSLDGAEYGPGKSVQFGVEVQNTGALRASFKAIIRIEDGDGHQVAELPPNDVFDLPGGGSTLLHHEWDTGLVLSGPYQIHGLLYDVAGNLLDEAAVSFSIVHDKDPALDTKVTSDKTVYQMFDQVHVTATLINTSRNTVVPPSLAHLTIRSPTGETVFSSKITTRELTPGTHIELPYVYDLTDAASGTYRVDLRISDSDIQQTLAFRSTEFKVDRRLVDALKGEVVASPTQSYTGNPVSCTETVTYLSAAESSQIHLTSQLIHFDSGHIIKELLSTVALSREQTLTQLRSINTASLIPGVYACVLNAEIDGITRRLSSAGFEIKPLPVRIDAEIGQGDRGRILILMDPEPASTLRLDRSDLKGAGTETPGSSIQRQFLETLLIEDGWPYNIVTNDEDFAGQLHTGEYTAYLLLSKQVKLGESLQKELREAVYRGEGLIEAGSHDQRQGRIDDILGIKFLGRTSGQNILSVLGSDVYPAQEAALKVSDKSLKALAENAQVLGLFSRSKVPAITSRPYGTGKAVYFGFDLLAEAAVPDSNPSFAELLLGALRHVQPTPFKPLAAGIYPLRLSLINRGIGTEGQAMITLPKGVIVVDNGKGDLIENNLIWPFEFISEDVLTFDSWIKLPASPMEIQALIRTGMSPNFTDLATSALQLIPDPSPVLANLITDARDLDAMAYRHIIKYLEWAERDRLEGNYAGVLSALIHASDALIELEPEVNTELRVRVAQAMRIIAQKL